MSSTQILITVSGGLGLFLLGMVIMTDGLRTIAGRSIRNALMRFTRNPVSGAITGAIGTAILQSSSATTVAAVGFVSAGLLTFSESLGIIFGANIGTTITGWLVALLGFKLNLTTMILPLILVGVLLRLSHKEWLRPIGLALAGFGLIFVGIDTMQEAMSGIDKTIMPSLFPEDSWATRLQLLLIGIVITVITQSSSAGIATTITALYVGAINFHQAAALIIGMDVGTTVTAAMATIGGTQSSRRTGFSHVIYNCFTGLGALLLISPFTQLWLWLNDGTAINQHAEIALVAFHTSFNILGVLIVLPITHHFAAMMYRLFPEQENPYTQPLDNRLLEAPDVAITASRVAIINQFTAASHYVTRLLASKSFHNINTVIDLMAALRQTQEYTDQIHIKTEQQQDWQRLYSCIHALDHLDRLLHRCQEPEKAQLLKEYRLADELSEQTKDTINKVIEAINNKDWEQAVSLSNQQLNAINNQTPSLRAKIMTAVTGNEYDLPTADDYLDSIRWQGRVMNHISRICYYLQESE